MSEWYARDNSRKLKAAFRSKGKSGRRTTNKCIYGYAKHPQDKSKWVVDEAAAPIIRRIFQMTIDTIGSGKIAAQLRTESVDRPGYHMSQIGVGDHQWAEEKYRSEWNLPTVAKILAKPEYAGHTVNLRTDTMGEANPLTGLLYCADCWRRMYNHRCIFPYKRKHASELCG